MTDLDTRMEPKHSCRGCGSVVHPIMTFGDMPLANGFLTAEQFGNESYFEMAVGLCADCSLFQLLEQPAPESMFHGQYAFFSRTSNAMCAHFRDVAARLADLAARQSEAPFIVELGCNDGVMLGHIAERGIRHLGVEPSGNVAAAARRNGVDVLEAFFDEGTARGIVSRHGQADILYAANVMCHIPDLQSVAKGVDRLLKPGGRFIFEDPYLGAMLEKTSFDQIYDEHVFIFSASSVSRVYAQYGLELVSVEMLPTHGGSMRYGLARKGTYPVAEMVTDLLAREEEAGFGCLETYSAFKAQCEKNRDDLKKLLQGLRNEGKTVAGYAATSKSTTVLNYAGIGPELIGRIFDTTPEKQGMYSPGRHIPVVPHAGFSEGYPDYAVLFAWNHEKEIMEKEQAFQAAGGRWIRFVPRVEIL